MSKINGYYEYAKLATAAYVDMSGFPAFTFQEFIAQANAQGRLPTSLAEFMFDSENNPEPVWSIPEGGYRGNDGTGFAATLFEKDGEKVLAIRGTEPEGAQLYLDLLRADLAGIGFVGFALSQTVSMINYVKRLTAPEGSDVIQLEWKYSLTEPGLVNSIPLPGVPGYLYLEASLVAGGGLGLIGEGETITVTGHSLGGHLAGMAARLFPELVDSAYTYNAPGVDPEYSADIVAGLTLLLSGNPLYALIAGTLAPEMKLTDEFIDLVQPWLPAAPASSFEGLSIYNLDSQSSIPGDNISLVSSVITNATAFGDKIDAITEGNSHLIEPLMDSLALHALFSSMNGDLTLLETNKLLQAASNRPENTAESLVEALHRLLIEDSAISLPETYLEDNTLSTWIGRGDIDKRNEYYQALLEIQDKIQSLPDLKIQPLNGNASAIKLKAVGPQLDLGGGYDPEDAIAYRYALVHLNPFVITGNADLYTDHNDGGRLDLYDSATRTGMLTDSYLEDRATVLAMTLGANTENNSEVVQRRDSRFNVEYKQVVEIDGQSEQVTIAELKGQISGSRGGRPARETRYVIFGSEANDVLYADSSSGSGSSRIYGGAGDDTLRGSLGSPDRLEGGLGDNRYYATPGDVIFDVDRQATIYFRGINIDNMEISGSYTQQGENVYRHDDRPVTIVIDNDGDATVRVGDDLIAQNFTIEHFMDPAQGFDNGNFRITLIEEEEEEEELPEGEDTYIGSEAFNRFMVIPDSTAGSNDFLAVMINDAHISNSNDPNIIQRIANEAGMYVDGVGGNNLLTGWVGDDVIYGGDGVNRIEGHDGNNRLFGRGSHDIIFGGSGDDYIQGGPGNNVLNGGDGNDIIKGGGGNSIIGGGGGSNVIYGGDGDNYIHGGYTMHILDFDWTAFYEGDSLFAEDAWSVDFKYTSDGYLYDFEFNNIGAVDDPGEGYGGNIIFGGGGDNIIFGHIGNDIIHGGVGRNYINGGSGDNKIWGGPSNDILVGGDGNDIIYAGEGDNELQGGKGDDILYGGPGNDILFGDEGDDVLYGMAGENILVGGVGNNELYGGSGNDILIGGRGNTVLYSVTGEGILILERKELQGTEGNNYLNAGGGDNLLFGGSGNDVLVSGSGNNELQGGLGNDSYHYHRGDGHDIIHDEGGFDKLYLHGITLEDLDFIQSENNLIISVSEDSSITLWNWQDSSPIDIILFDDGRVLFPDDFFNPDPIGRAYYAEGDEPYITGTNGNDYFHVEAQSAVLYGGAGNNTYYISELAEEIFISGTSGSGQIIFDFELGSKELSGNVENGTLNLNIGSFQLTVDNWFEAPVERLLFADGAEITRNELKEPLGAVGIAPILNKEIEIPDVEINQLFEYQIPEDLFIDSIIGLDLAYTVDIEYTNYMGQGWLSYDSSSRVISGTPASHDIGSATITITARDSSFLTSSISFGLDITPSVTEYVVIDPLTINVDTGVHLAYHWEEPEWELQPVFKPIGDVNGDGIDDLLVETNTGQAYVVYGQEGGFQGQIDFLNLDGTDGFEIQHEDAGKQIRHGFLLHGIKTGDVNGNGIDDLFLTTSDGQAYILFGSQDRDAGQVILSDADSADYLRISHDLNPNTAMFQDIADYNNDGLNDVRFMDYVIYGSAINAGSIQIEDLDSSQGFQLGMDAIAIGDINGDGITDYFIRGESAIVFGTENGLPASIDIRALDGTEGFRLHDATGAISTVTGIGDFNGNGIDDFAVVSPSNGSGKVFVVYGSTEPFADEIDLDNVSGNAGLQIIHASSEGFSGFNGFIHELGDVNGDGKSDLIIGQWIWNISNTDAIVIYGTDSEHDAPIQSHLIGPELGYRLRPTISSGSDVSGIAVGDVTGNGLIDIQVNSHYIHHSNFTYQPTVLYGTSSQDELIASGEVIEVHAGAGNDTIFISNIDLSGNKFSYDDLPMRIYTGSGNNTVIIGESGQDINKHGEHVNIEVYGGAGDNNYVVNGVNSHITIFDKARTNARNTIAFGEEYSAADMKLTISESGNVLIYFNDELSTVELWPKQFAWWAVETWPWAVEKFEFSDGTMLDYRQLIARGFTFEDDGSGFVINGTNATDRMYGGDEGVNFRGGLGDDFLYGGKGDDFLYGEAGNNYLDGGPGNDYLEGGPGNDTYYYERGYGSDIIFDRGGHDTLLFGPGIRPSHLILEVDDSDLVIKLSDTDQIRIWNYFHISGDHIIEDIKFHDGLTLSSEELLLMKLEPTTLISDGGGNVIDVETWMEYVFVGDGDNQINISTDNRTRPLGVTLGSGNNTINVRGSESASGAISPVVAFKNVSGYTNYNIDFNVGRVIIDDSSNTTVGNSLTFGSNYNRANLRLGIGSLMLTFGDDYNEIHLMNFDPDDVLGGPRTIETFRFADGTVLSYEELVSQGFDISGTSGNDVLRGTNLTDRIVALEGNNTFEGGQGDDYLEGGTGNNTYIYNPGDGHDVIFDHGGNNRIVFGDGIDADMLELERSDDDLVINIIGDGQITVQAWYDPSGNHQIASLGFADGQVINTLDLLEAPNNPPILNQPLSDVTVNFGKPFNLTLPEDTFIDIDPGDELVLTATLADGSALPGWLTFNPESATFSGKAKLFDFGAHEITVSATDLAGDSVSDTFTLTVTLTVTHPGKGSGHPFFPGGWGKHKFWGGFGMKWGHPSSHGGWRQAPPGNGAAFGPGNPFVHGQVQSLVQAMATFSPGGYGGSHFSSNVIDDMSSMIAAAWEAA